MARWYTRSEQRAYRDRRKAQAELVADRLLGKKKKVDPDVEDLFSGTQMRSPFQYIQYGGITRSVNPISNIYIGGMTK